MQFKTGYLRGVVFLALSFSINAKADFVGSSGNVLTALLPLSAAVITLQKEDWDGLWQFTKSEAVAIGAAEGLKSVISSTRPNGESGSFPSAHTTIAVSSAQYLQSRYGWEYALPAYVASAYVGWSRVNANEHYWQDVLGGAAIGFASSYFFTESIYGAKISAIATPNQVYVSVRKNW